MEILGQPPITTPEIPLARMLEAVFPFDPDCLHMILSMLPATSVTDGAGISCIRNAHVNRNALGVICPSFEGPAYPHLHSLSLHCSFDMFLLLYTAA